MWSLILNYIKVYDFYCADISNNIFHVSAVKNAKLSYAMARLLPKTSETQLDFNYL